MKSNIFVSGVDLCFDNCSYYKMRQLFMFSVHSFCSQNDNCLFVICTISFMPMIMLTSCQT